MPTPPWSCQQVDKNVFIVTVPLERRADYSFEVLPALDVHYDSPKNQRQLLKKHLQRVVDVNGLAFFPGDLYDTMGSRQDLRADKGELRVEYVQSNYFNAIVNDSCDFFEPYASHIAIVGEGNHETKVKKHQEIDLIQMFIQEMNHRGHKMFFGSYSGYIIFKFEYEANGAKYCTNNITICYHHGSGYGSPASRKYFAHENPDADIIVFGHHHNFSRELVARRRIAKGGKIYKDHQTILCCPSYKDDYGDGSHGFAVEKGHRPKVLGAWLIIMYWDRINKRMDYEVREAR